MRPNVIKSLIKKKAQIESIKEIKKKQQGQTASPK